MSNCTLFLYFLGFGSCLQLGIISSKSTLLKYPIVRNFCEWRDSNPVRLGDQRKLFLCAMLPTPHVKLSRWLRYLIKSLVHWNIFVRRTFGCQTQLIKHQSLKVMVHGLNPNWIKMNSAKVKKLGQKTINTAVTKKTLN